MGFFKTAINEFGKKTGKALGNRMYGAYADDKRVGVNRGTLKGKSDGLKIVTSEREEATTARTRGYSTETESKKNQKLLKEVLNIELEPSNKNSLIKSLTALSVYVEMAVKESNTDEYFVAAKSKFDTGVAMLQALDPNNKMTQHFIQKKREWRKEKWKRTVGILVLIVVCLGILIGVFLYADKL